ncbi:transposase [Saccharothrix sp. HUAS TT1]|uniref:transposase n=1 Tax=unclassified Saccharothrix TaxID=2593673 RepID=UPI00345B86DD
MLGVDDFALRRGRRYATVLIDAVTHRRVDVLPNRRAAPLTAWLREHPGVSMVCGDGSATYAEAVRQGAPDAVQIGDRWHIWNNPVAAAERTVTAHSTCWYVGPARRTKAEGERALQRHTTVHGLLDQEVGLLECARRLGISLNTVKRYARIPSAEQLRRLRPTGAAWSTPAATTYAAAWHNSPTSRSPTCSPRSTPWATPAAPTSWSATSNKAAPNPTASHPPHGAGSPG